jgi:hypothetical protein
LKACEKEEITKVYMNAHTWYVKHMHVKSLSNLESLKVKVINNLIENLRVFDDLEKVEKGKNAQS